MNADDLSISLSDEIYNNGKLWSDGWYLYGQGEVSGPYTASEIFPAKLQSTLESKAREHYLVSRKGLSRWYDFQALQNLFLQGQHAKNYLPPPPPGVLAAAPAKRRKLFANELGFSAAKKNSSFSRLTMRQLFYLFAEEGLRAQPAVTSSSFAWATAREGGTATNPSRPLSYYHMIYKGRLRLGGMEKPWHVGLLKFLLTLGYGWKTWYEQALVEVTYHLDDPQAADRLQRLWLALVPFYHLVMAYRLAKLVLQMEVQNHYRRTSPFKAFFLAICPPLVMIYLQHALNRHWVLHTCHAINQEAERGLGVSK